MTDHKITMLDFISNKIDPNYSIHKISYSTKDSSFYFENESYNENYIHDLEYYNIENLGKDNLWYYSDNENRHSISSYGYHKNKIDLKYYSRYIRR